MTGLFVVLAIFVSAYFIWDDFQKTEPAPIANKNNENKAQKKKEEKNEAIVKIIPADPVGSNIPNLDREVLVKEKMTEDTKAKMVAEIKNVSDVLKKNPEFFDGWMNLGVLRKFIGDYDGAREAWEYAAALRPDVHITYNNLGDLYHFYLKDFTKAEMNMRRAVDVKSDFIMGYTHLHELYLYSLKSKSDLADDVLMEGIQKNQDDPELRIVLASYYRDIGDKANARKYFAEAIALNPPNKTALQLELAALDSQ